jgi:hypothetical protein
MPEVWYERVPQDAPLLQGDFVPNCPLLSWKRGKPNLEGRGEAEVLSDSVEAIRQDVIVMTQACDLEQKKVQDVVVCPIYSISEFKVWWESSLKAKGQNPTPKSWSKFCDDIRDGFQWNYAMLNSGDVQDLKTEHRIVNFHEIYTLPLEFLTAIAANRGPRIRLCPPYREHLSQAFARYFMRVGLPSPINKGW